MPPQKVTSALPASQKFRAIACLVFKRTEDLTAVAVFTAFSKTERISRLYISLLPQQAFTLNRSWCILTENYLAPPVRAATLIRECCFVSTAMVVITAYS